ncbi:MAG: long-chain fatty acid--CoA ligase [Haloferacaceae archaeon]
MERATPVAAGGDVAFDVPTLPRLFETRADRHAASVAQRYKGGVYDRSLADGGVLPSAPDGDYAGLTYAEMRDVVRNLAAGFRDLGVVGDTRVGVAAHTRMEWAQVDFAVQAAGGVVTTVYPESTTDRVRYLLDDADVLGAVVEDAGLVETTLAATDDLSFVVVLDAAAAYADRDDVFTLADVHERGAATFDADAYESWLDDRDPADLASVVYTSGTTGRPKGVRLSHRNLGANVEQFLDRFDRSDGPAIDADTTHLSVLPLAHVFERTVGHYLPFAAGATVAYAERPDTLAADFAAVRPTMTTGVPRLYEQLFAAVEARVGEKPFGDRLFDWAVDAGRAHREADDPGPGTRLRYALADRLVLSKVRDAFGGRLDFGISGGASLPAALCARYHDVGVPLLEGYGLTETAPVVSVNPPDAPKIGTIGPPVAGLDARIDPDAGDAPGDDAGELQVRGPNVTEGYWRRPAATDEAFTDDGWLKTGDVVERDGDGYLTFRWRASETVVLSTGESLAPAPIEGEVTADPLVAQCLVVGDERPYAAALLVPDVEAVQAWADRQGVDLPSPDSWPTDRLRARLDETVTRANEGLQSHERVERFAVVTDPFSRENGLLTPTLKKRRRAIVERHAETVDALYGEDG